MNLRRYRRNQICQCCGYYYYDYKEDKIRMMLLIL